MKFPGSFVHHPHCISSDHCPLLISLSGLDPPPHQRSFKFEEMWLSDEWCAETVEASWSSHSHGPGDSQILKQIEKCGKDLAWWNHNVFGNVRKELERKKSLLVQAEQAAIVNGQNQWLRELKDEVNLLLVRESRLWSQRSQVLWIKHGDNNTRLFIAEPLNDTAKIGFEVLWMSLIIGRSIHRKLLWVSSTIIRVFSQHQTRIVSPLIISLWSSLMRWT